MDMLKYAKLSPLLGKTLTDLTVEDLELALTTFDIQVSMTEELRSAALMLLQGQNIHSVADVIQSPESVQQLVSFFKAGGVRPEPIEALIQCPHCREFFLKQL